MGKRFRSVAFILFFSEFLLMRTVHQVNGRHGRAGISAFLEGAAACNLHRHYLDKHRFRKEALSLCLRKHGQWWL